MAAVAAAVSGGGGVFYVLPILFGDCFEFICVFCPAAEVTTTTEAEDGVIVI
jgi:hypothetical protein